MSRRRQYNTGYYGACCQGAKGNGGLSDSPSLTGKGAGVRCNIGPPMAPPRRRGTWIPACAGTTG